MVHDADLKVSMLQNFDIMTGFSTADRSGRGAGSVVSTFTGLMSTITTGTTGTTTTSYTEGAAGVD